jgi:hypothetical protein
MDNLKNKVVTVYDPGNYQEVAVRLARDFGKVNYFKPWKSAAPQFRQLFIGDGIPNVRRVRNFFDVIDETDLFVFPDVYDGDLQLHLEKLGKRVWGSRKAEEFEYRRGLFKKSLKDVGLPVPDYKEIEGMKALRKFLEHNPGWVVKRDIFRGDGETVVMDDPPSIRAQLNAMDAYYDEAGEEMLFIVEKVIDTEIEVGYDGISIDGDYTDGFVDYEIKNRACIAAFTKYEDMNEHVRFVNDAFAPKLRERNCRSMFGTEIRVKDDVPYFIDATCRMPSPPGELELEMFENIAQVFWQGSVGEFVQVKPAAQFGVEVMIYARWEELSLLPVTVPDSVRQWVKLGSSFRSNGVDYMIQCNGQERIPWMREELGVAIGIGDSIKEAIELCMEHAYSVSGANLEITEEAIGEALAKIKKGEKLGIEFTDEKIPEPESVMEGDE